MIERLVDRAFGPVHFGFNSSAQPQRSPRLLRFRLTLHNRRGAEDAKVAQRIETEPAPFQQSSC